MSSDIAESMADTKVCTQLCVSRDDEMCTAIIKISTFSHHYIHQIVSCFLGNSFLGKDVFTSENESLGPGVLYTGTIAVINSGTCLWALC